VFDAHGRSFTGWARRDLGDSFDAFQFPWCAHFFDGTGASNCGFDSQEQCEMTVRGNGGTCDKNLSYRGPPAAPVDTPAATPVAAPTPPSPKLVALNAKEKLKTCQFGADDQKLAGTARKNFISRCMANRNDPRGSTPPASGAK
jgi:hypothetical protein